MKDMVASEQVPGARAPVVLDLTKGSAAPLGATPSPAGVNFSVFSRHAKGLELLLFDGVDDARPARVIHVDPATNRTYHYWHVFVPGARAGQIYGYRAQGPFDPVRGMRFDPRKVLLDPYGRGVVVPKSYSREAARREGDNTATAMKSVVVDPHTYDCTPEPGRARPRHGIRRRRVRPGGSPTSGDARR